MARLRIAASLLLALLATGARGLAQIPNAGPDQTQLYPRVATLAGSVQGATPLSYWTAEGNGSLANFIVKYDDASGVTAIGPLKIGNGGMYGFPTDLVRIGTAVYGVDGLRRQIYTVNPASGVVAPIGTPWPATFADVESMTYDPVGDRLFAVDRATGQLLTIDRANNVPTRVGTSTLVGYAEIRSLAWRASNSTLYAVDQATHAILTIDPATGAPSVISHTAVEAHHRTEELEFFGDRLCAMDAIDNGSGLVSGQLQQILPETGAAIDIGPLLDQVSARCLLVNSLPERHLWSQVSGPAPASFSDAYALTPTVSFPQPGVYVFQLRVFTSSGSVVDTVTIDEGSWTTFTRSPDTRVVYVSSSTGNDANNGLSSATAKRTIAAAKELVRDTFPDWILLKRGDVWDEPLGNWGRSGRSTSERMLISSYGGSPVRPLLRTGVDVGFSAQDGSSNNYVAIVGLEFWANRFDGSQGTPAAVQVFGSVAAFLLEDCYIHGYHTGVVLQGTSASGLANAAIRRCVIVDSISGDGSHANGIFAHMVNGLLIEECVLDNNGWRFPDHPPGALPGHNAYLNNGLTGLVFRGNIVANTDGVQMRAGGLSEDNLFLRTVIAFEFGAGTVPEPAGVTGNVRGNVILDGNDYDRRDANRWRGWGLVTGNAVNTTFNYNVVAHNATGSSPRPWVLNFQNNGNPQGLQNVTFDHNVVYDWGCAGSGAEVATYQDFTILNLQLSNNDIHDAVDGNFLGAFSASTPDLPQQIHGLNNRWYRSLGHANQMFQLSGIAMGFGEFNAAIGDTTSAFGPIAYPDANRTIASYNASIGGAAALSAFMAQARLQSKSNWRPQYTADAVNDYIRVGFGLPPLAFTPSQGFAP